MSIRDNMVQQVLGNPGKYSIQQLQSAMQSGVLPAYIVVPIIQDKVQQQKQMQASMEMQQQPPQSTVAEQIMQEAQGVEQLPTNLPQEYAHGGVVALAGGGDPEDVEMELNRIKAIEALRKAGIATKATLSDLASLPGRMSLSSIENLIGKPLRSVGVPFPLVPEEVYGGNRNAFLPRVSTFQQQEEPSQPPAMFPVDNQAAAESLKSALADVGGVGVPKPAGGVGGIAGLAGAGRTPMKMQVPPGQSYADIAKQSLGEYEAKAAAGEKEAQDKIAAERAKVSGKAYEGLEASLRKEAEQMGADKDQAKYMAIFKAGLAMMGGTSRSALENIGKGAMVGAEDYQKAAADIKKAEKENQRMMAQIEQARRAEAIGDRDKMVSSIEAFRDRNDARLKYIASGIASATGMDKTQAFEIAKTEFSADKALEGHRIQAAATLGAAEIRGSAALEAALARMEGKAEMTPQLRMQAMKMLDENTLRTDVLKEMGLKKVPESAAALMQFNEKLNRRREQELRRIIDTASGGMGVSGAPAAGGTNPYQGFSVRSVE